MSAAAYNEWEQLASDAGLLGNPLPTWEQLARGKGCTEGSIEKTSSLDGDVSGLVNRGASGGGNPLPLLETGELRSWNRDEAYARFVAERARLRFTLDVEQKLHGVTVKLWLGDEADYIVIVVGGWPQSPDPDDRVPAPASITLPELYAIAVSGEVRQLKKASIKRWGARAAVEAGLISKPTPVQLPLLNAPTSPAATTWRVIAKLVAYCRLTEPEHEPVGISTPWLSSWSGVPEPVLRSGKRWLAKRGYIVKVGERPMKGRPRPLDLWHVAGAHFATNGERNAA